MLNPEPDPDFDFGNIWIRIKNVILKITIHNTGIFNNGDAPVFVTKNVSMLNMFNLDAHNLTFLALSHIFSEHALIF